MDAQATRHRIPAVFLWGALAVIVWAALTALLGGGQAHADDDDSKPLDGLTSLVGGVVTKVVDPVIEKTADVVTEATAPVVAVAEKTVAKTAETVAAVPVVGEPAANALGAASETAASLTETVTEVTSSAPVSSIVRPVTNVVREVPVVGGVLEDLGATDLLDESAGAVDGVVDTLTPIVENTAPPVVDALDPQLPGDGPAIIPGDEVSPITEGDTSAPSSNAIAATATTEAPRGALSTSAWAMPSWERTAPSATAYEADESDARDPRSPTSAPALVTSPASSSAGPGGSSSGVNAVLHHLPVHADGAWTSAELSADSAPPPSPVGKTDVSPD